jgi:hypothetical protein
MTSIKVECRHRKLPELGYVQAHADAQERIRRGEKQLRCFTCGKYVWQSYYNKSSDSSKGAK